MMRLAPAPPDAAGGLALGRQQSFGSRAGCSSGHRRVWGSRWRRRRSGAASAGGSSGPRFARGYPVLAAVAEWVLAHDGRIAEALEVRSSAEEGAGGEERGVFARGELKAGEELAFIPRSCFVESTCHSGEAEEPPELAALCAGAGGLGEGLRLARRLLGDGAHTDAPSGRFGVFYRTLPRELHVPILWEEEELYALAAHSRALANVSKRRRRLEEFHAALSLHGSQVALRDVLWADAVVSSRCFRYTSEAGRTSACFVPVADLFNHHPAAGEWTSYSFEPGGLSLKCLRDIAAGEEVLITYGALSNDHILHLYGFAVKVNEEENGYCPDELTFAVPVPVACDAMKSSLFRKVASDLTPAGSLPVKVTFINNVPNLFSVLRLALADEADMAILRLRRPQPSSVYEVRGISVRNELQVLAFLWMHCCACCTGLSVAGGAGGREPLVESFRQAVLRARGLLLGGGPAVPPPPPPAAVPPGQAEAEAAAAAPPPPPMMIVEIARLALRQAHAEALADRPEEEEARRSWRRLARACAAPSRAGSRRPEGERANEVAWRCELVERVLASDRRLSAHFAALAAVAAAVMGLEPARREALLPILEASTPLRGLTPASRNIIQRYVKGFCRCFARELDDLWSQGFSAAVFLSPTPYEGPAFARKL